MRIALQYVDLYKDVQGSGEAESLAGKLPNIILP